VNPLAFNDPRQREICFNGVKVPHSGTSFHWCENVDDTREASVPLLRSILLSLFLLAWAGRMAAQLSAREDHQRLMDLPHITSLRGGADGRVERYACRCARTGGAVCSAPCIHRRRRHARRWLGGREGHVHGSGRSGTRVHAAGQEGHGDNGISRDRDCPDRRRCSVPPAQRRTYRCAELAGIPGVRRSLFPTVEGHNPAWCCEMFLEKRLAVWYNRSGQEKPA
jgi:hypothetical protein